jgi:hypothetical protein
MGQPVPRIGVDRLEWRQWQGSNFGEARQVSRIGIAISGDPNPADIIDVVVLAASLGYEIGLGRRRSWWRPVRGSGGLRDADLVHPAWHQHQLPLRPRRANDCNGRFNNRGPVRRRLHPFVRTDRSIDGISDADRRTAH